MARGIGIFLGHLGWHVLRHDRRRALANIGAAFPDWTPRQRRSTIRKMFHHLGMTLAEVLWLPNLDAETCAKTTTFEGLENLRPGEGMIGITGHCGNWEWIAHAIALRTPVTVLHRGRDEPKLNLFVTDLRAKVGINTIDRGSTAAGREMIRAIRHGSILAFLIDQNIRAESIKVPFFGRPALTPIGPARMAVRMGVPITRMFGERRNGKIHIRILEPIIVRQDDDPVALTARLTADIEAQIRRVPEQWVWMHDRYRERPKWDVTKGEE
ncbi:MAG: Kdo2-lipid lauroyltransferase/acyltransferase [Thermoanaerobaculia bacterium]|nr:Kdo2-lipid lauroyltransferase/acyltransferase [Thermoanaerobaculia bacterium]